MKNLEKKIIMFKCFWCNDKHVDPFAKCSSCGKERLDIHHVRVTMKRLFQAGLLSIIISAVCYLQSVKNQGYHHPLDSVYTSQNVLFYPLVILFAGGLLFYLANQKKYEIDRLKKN